MNLLENSTLRILAIAMTIFLFLTIAIPVLPRNAMAMSKPSGIIVPLYTYPSDGTWQSVIQAKNSNPNVPIVAVINPNNGPGGSKDQNYVQGIQGLQSAGVTVLGYVYTSYASRSISSVESEINTYHNWYNVNGIFFDEMSNVPGNENYYSQLNNYVKSIGLTLTVGNPGTTVPNSYIGTVDVLVIYESPGLPAISSLADWTSGYSKTNFAFISFGVGSLPAQNYINSTTSYVSYLYITDDTLPNPYDTLPSYFSSLVKTLNSSSPPPSNSVYLNVNSVSLNGKPISGLWTTIQQNGNVVDTGYTPLRFKVSPGIQYIVTVANYKQYVFDHWNTGSTSHSITITPKGNVTLTAYYKIEVSLKVESVTLSGSSFTGMWTTIQQNGNTVKTGYTTLTYSGTSGVTYVVSVADYGNYHFSHWSNGSTNRYLTITPTQSTTLVAYYST